MPRAINGKKICTKCKEKKLTKHFHRHHGTSDGYTSMCKICKNANARAKVAAIKQKFDVGLLKQPEEKRCPRCKQVKPASEFSPEYSNKTGLKTNCKDCSY